MKQLRLLSSVVFAAGCVAGCAESGESGERGASDDAPPPNIQAWMDRLTVEHAYDPETGFIVARETITLPAVISDAPRLDDALNQAGDEGLVIAFATADRCAPCQQYKKDALNDPRVIARLEAGGFVATHVEVDKMPELADAHLGGRMIPMTYALRGGERVAQLRGQKSADDLLAWLDEVDPG